MSMMIGRAERESVSAADGADESIRAKSVLVVDCLRRQSGDIGKWAKEKEANLPSVGVVGFLAFFFFERKWGEVDGVVLFDCEQMLLFVLLRQPVFEVGR